MPSSIATRFLAWAMSYRFSMARVGPGCVLLARSGPLVVFGHVGDSQNSSEAPSLRCQVRGHTDAGLVTHNRGSYRAPFSNSRHRCRFATHQASVLTFSQSRDGPDL